MSTQTWNKINQIYCISNPQHEPDRTKRLVNLLTTHGVPKDKMRISAPTWGSTLTNEEIWKVYDPWMTQRSWPSFTFKSRALLKGEISLVLNFLAAAQDAVNNKYETILVLESDVYLRPDFSERLEKVVEEANLKYPDWSAISLSDGVGSHSASAANRSLFAEQTVMECLIYPGNWKFPFRCTDSMVLRGSFLEKIIGTMIPFRDCLDWELNYQLFIHNGLCLWAEPHIVEQGTCKKRDISTLPC